MVDLGRIFAIKKYAIHDGPNIRTTVFFKGCPLRCAWCHNPEGISSAIERVWVSDRCIGCGECLEGCQAGALFFENNDPVRRPDTTTHEETWPPADAFFHTKKIIRDLDLCVGCGHCVDICPALAHEATGYETDVTTIMEAIKKDIPFYDQSGGGVTFSGGDPLFQPQFLLALLKASQNLGIHRAVDTCAHATTDLLPEIAQHTDLFLIDIKHMESDTHKKLTGVPNGLILENIRCIAGMKKEIRFRIPLIEGVNSDPYNIEKTGRFIADIAPESGVDLLPYHEMASSKYGKLGMAVSPLSFRKPDNSQLTRCRQQLEGLGLKVTVGG